MATNTVSRYTGTDPNGESSVMAELVVTSAGLFALAELARESNYTLRLWIKAGSARTATAYIGATAFSMAVTADWKVFKFTALADANSSCDIYLPAGTYYIWHPMLEASTKASDYRQAPEDVQESINAVADDAAATAAAYTDMRLVEFVTTEQLDTAIRQTQEEISMSVNRQTTRAMTYAQAQAASALNSANASTDNKLRNYVTTTKHTADLRILDNRISSAVSATESLAEYVDGDFYTQITSEYSTLISQTASGIESRVQQTYATITTVNGIASRVTTAESRITQQANQITSVVSELTTAESTISQQATQITSLISTVNGQQTAITQNASNINLCVKSANLVSEINASTGQIKMTSNRFVVDSTYFKLSANGAVTASNLTLTGGSIKSANYATSEGQVTAGTYINLSTGAISTKNFKLTSSGTMTATNATLTGSFETGADGDGCKLQIVDGKINAYWNNNRVGALGAITSSDGTIARYALLASTNYQGITIGTLYNHEVTPYYMMNYGSTYNSYGCRHWFSGDIKFTSGKVKSSIQFADDYGISYGGNYAFRYVSGSGVKVGITGTDACSTSILGSEIFLGANITLTNGSKFKNSIALADNVGITYGGNFALVYSNTVSNPGVFLGIGGQYACATYIRGSDVYIGGTNIYLQAPAYTNQGYLVTSDRRKKKNITDLDHRYTALLDNLSAATYQYKESRPDQTMCGFIAQDVKAAMEKVGLSEKDFGGYHDHYGDGKDLHLDYTQFIPILWEIVKKQQTEIDELRRKSS
ncbi:MAG: tail fiber domain-containing protein [Ruminococcus sp.]|uniref:tail fiber domain-containing protein n=1 Tax=Ruminococcus sp. TaxID=41978 RepID=UPI0025EAE221|nr:tail fiber domain-containing protein [Ruminococcus sp.]MCR5540069.1 tail fiber domain-containing protein [Ruminococcus sp.]